MAAASGISPLRCRARASCNNLALSLAVWFGRKSPRAICFPPSPTYAALGCGYAAWTNTSSEIRFVRLRDRDFVFVKIIAVVVLGADILGFRDRLIVQEEALRSAPFAGEGAGIVHRHCGGH